MIPAPDAHGGGAPVEIGIFTVDRDLVIRTWDAWLAERSGIAAERALGRALAEVVPSIEERGLASRFAQVLATGEVQVLASAFHHYLVPCAPVTPTAAFEQMQQRVTLGPLREGEQVVGVMATIEDVTDRIERERALAGELRADDWKVRRRAVQQLTREAHPDLLVSLVTSLRHEHRDFNVLSSALQLLGASEVDLTAPLVALLHDADADLRIQAALALGERQTTAATDALIGALRDPDVNVRFHAIEALGRMRAAEAVDALAELAEGDDFFLVFPAIDALAQIRDARVGPRLIPLLASPDVVEPVADALGELGSADAVRPLVEVLNSSGPAGPISRALARIYERYEQRYGGGALVASEFAAAIRPSGAQRVLDAISASALPDLAGVVTVLGWLRGPAVERALARLLGHAAVRPAAIEAIVRQGGGVAETLIEQLGAPDPDVRLAAIVALGRLADRRATLPLTAALSGERAEIVAASAALARIGDPRAFEALLPLLAHDDATVRQGAIAALNSLGHPDMAAKVSVLLSSPDTRLRESAVRIAGYFGYRQCIDALIERAADPDEAVRRAAVEQLPFLDDARGLDALGRALHDGSARVRAAAAQAFAHVERDRAHDPLVSALADRDGWVRYYAVRSLGSLGERAAIERLGVLASDDPAMHVRIAALEAIGVIGGDAATERLLPHATHADPEIAAAVLRGLGRLPDPRAAGALRAALRSDEPTRRIAAVTGLRAGADAEGIDALAWTAVADADATVADAAIDALATLAARDTPYAERAITALISTTAEPARRSAIATALTRLPEQRIPHVAAGLRHAHPEVRRTIVDVLARMCHPVASAALRTALDDSDPDVREAAIISLDQLGVRGLGQRFAELARADASRRVRRAAAAALGRAFDPESGDADGTR